MNRRSFLSGLGAAVATFATVTRLGETNAEWFARNFSHRMEGDFDTENLRYLSTDTRWYLVGEPPGLKYFHRSRLP